MTVRVLHPNTLNDYGLKLIDACFADHDGAMVDVDYQSVDLNEGLDFDDTDVTSVITVGDVNKYLAGGQRFNIDRILK